MIEPIEKTCGNWMYICSPDFFHLNFNAGYKDQVIDIKSYADIQDLKHLLKTALGDFKLMEMERRRKNKINKCEQLKLL